MADRRRRKRKRKRKRADIPYRLKAGQRLVIEATSRALFRLKGPRRLNVRIEESDVDNQEAFGKN